MNVSLTTDKQGKIRHKQAWAFGALIAAATASVVLSISAWAGDEDASAGAPTDSMHVMAGRGGGLFGGRHLSRLLDGANATATQRDQVKQIVNKAETDLKALREQDQSLREQGLKLWAQPVLDDAAAESLRQQMLAQHDKVSKRLMQAMLDLGKVLTPEQRVKVTEQMQTFHARMMKRWQAHMAASGPLGAHKEHGVYQPQEN